MIKMDHLFPVHLEESLYYHDDVTTLVNTTCRSLGKPFKDVRSTYSPFHSEGPNVHLVARLRGDATESIGVPRFCGTHAIVMTNYDDC
jgi:hypothetical protein